MKPISTHELTIGNLVYYKIPGKPRPIPIKICSIITNLNEKDPEYIEALDFDWIPFSATNIRPIPLTRKRLEKNGFVKEVREYFEGGTKEVYEMYVNNHNELYLIKDKTGYRVGCPIGILREFVIPIKYVHQLQNLLRCCGEFELANNFKP